MDVSFLFRFKTCVSFSKAIVIRLGLRLVKRFDSDSSGAYWGIKKKRIVCHQNEVDFVCLYERFFVHFWPSIIAKTHQADQVLNDIRSSVQFLF